MASKTPATSSSNPLSRLLKGERSGRAWLQQQKAPIEPIGISEQYCLIRDPTGEVVALRPKDFGKWGLLVLFGAAMDDLKRLFPKEDGPGWNDDLAAMVIMGACSECGIVDPRRYGFTVAFSRSSKSGSRLRKLG